MNIRAFLAEVIIASIVCAQNPPPATPQVLVDATPITNTEKQGNAVDFEVLEEIAVNGQES